MFRIDVISDYAIEREREAAGDCIWQSFNLAVARVCSYYASGDLAGQPEAVMDDLRRRRDSAIVEADAWAAHSLRLVSRAAD